MKKKVVDLIVGDKVVTFGGGGYLKVYKFDDGFYPNSRIIFYENGTWSCLQNDDTVEIILLQIIN